MAAPAISERFVLERKIGTGGFGSVHVAFDRERQTRVALKRLERLDGGSLYRFKQEFRALADLRHANLVALHELFATDGVWCFTMELLEGIRFDRFVRGEDPGALDDAVPTSTTGVLSPGSDLRSDVTLPLVTPAPAMRAAVTVDLNRLRTALRGVISGVLALHRAGLLHRDLKPSNVLVTATGRAVILDFGLVATGVVDVHQSMEGRIAGTPAYMSPEQARGAAVSAASDLYAVGLMLYEALAGGPAFTGTAVEILAARAARDPADPRTRVAGLPDDLCDLAMALLARDPALRPSGEEVARRLGLDEATAAPTAPATQPGPTLVGRERELAALEQAATAARGGSAVVAHVHGSSGLGKTALLRAFLGRAAADRSAVILDGRCYDRESVPYKAIDEVVDALGRFLQRLPALEAAGLMPRDGRALLRLFPTLGRLDFIASLPGREPTADPQELRRRAFGALRELLARLCDTARVIIAIDDVQWGDVDSAALLAALVAPPNPPPVLLVITSREGEAVSGEIARTLRTLAPGVSCHEVVDVPLAPLAATEAEVLARSLLGAEPPVGVDTAALARESGGNPLFVGELCRALAAGRRQAASVTLPAVLGERISALPESARSVLQALVCAGRPEGESVLGAVTDLEPGAAAEACGILRHEHLVGVIRVGGRAALDVLHD
jgi:hypothetical protein